MDPAAVRSLVEFAYSSRIPFSYASAPQVIVASDMLQFTEVKQACCDYLQRHIDPTNCLDLMQFADSHTCPELHRATQLHCNLHFTSVSQQPAFLETTLDRLESYLLTISEWREKKTC